MQWTQWYLLTPERQDHWLRRAHFRLTMVVPVTRQRGLLNLAVGSPQESISPLLNLLTGISKLNRKGNRHLEIKALPLLRTLQGSSKRSSLKDQYFLKGLRICSKLFKVLKSIEMSHKGDLEISQWLLPNPTSRNWMKPLWTRVYATTQQEDIQ